MDEHRIERYLDEEQLLLERMSLEKKKYMSAPESHPDYSREWERFYNYKRSKHGNINPAYLHDEWVKQILELWILVSGFKFNWNGIKVF